ncbi:hypothetical protein AB0E59_09510 [Lentzea sp. NPDC034063]|uniref:hypothetical protein n=1 Tax=unclassified Lentzea TaxID=2643253 RepID=UPI0033D19EAA
MTGVEVSAPLVLAGLVAVLVLWVCWRLSVRRARKAAEADRGGARLLSLTGRVLVGAGLIAGVQWLVLTHPGASGWARLAALLVPALFASWVLVRALTVTAVSDHLRGRGRRG